VNLHEFKEPILFHRILDFKNICNTPIIENNLIFLALNMMRCRAVGGSLAQIAIEKGVDILMLQDPHVYKNIITGFPKSYNCFISTDSQAALLLKKNIPVYYICSNHFLVCCTIITQFGKINLASVYVKPSQNLKDCLDCLRSIIVKYKGSWLIHGDFNAKSELWGYPEENNRGCDLLDFTVMTKLTVINNPDSPPTSHTPQGDGHPDLTLVTSDIVELLLNWTVLDIITASDHSIINWELRTNSLPIANFRFKTKYINPEKIASYFTENKILNNLYIDSHFNIEDANDVILKILNTTLQICIKKLKIRSYKPVKELNWWCKALLLQRRRLKALYRRWKAATVYYPDMVIRFKVAYYKALANYKKSINVCKLKAWRNYCSQCNETFGQHFKLWRGKSYKNVRLPTASHSNPEVFTCNDILNGVFMDSVQINPSSIFYNDNTSIGHKNCNFEAITTAEIKLALSKIAFNKAPGPYGLDKKIVLALFLSFPNLICDLYNWILTNGLLPHYFKISSVVLIKKADRPDDLPSSYRPICLSPTLFKVLEKIIFLRMLYFSHVNKVLSNNQYGFRELRSTEHALIKILETVLLAKSRKLYTAIIAADITGAFDNVQHRDIFKALGTFNFPEYIITFLKTYLETRMVILNTPDQLLIRRIMHGVPQGSSSGPLLWNLVLETFLRIQMPDNITVVAYADDVTFIITGNSRNRFEFYGDLALFNLDRWCTEKKLMISTEKTKVIFMFGAAKLQRKRFKLRNRNLKEVVN